MGGAPPRILLTEKARHAACLPACPPACLPTNSTHHPHTQHLPASLSFSSSSASCLALASRIRASRELSTLRPSSAHTSS